MKNTCIVQAGRPATVSHSEPHSGCGDVPLGSCYFDQWGHNKIQACVALAGAAAQYKAQSIQCQAFVCCFDLLLTTAPPNMCGGEPAPPPLNTFPHINKPYRCRNAWGPAFTQLLESSLLIRRLFGTFHRHTPVSTHTDSQKQHEPPAHLLALRYPSTHGPQVRDRRCDSGDETCD